MILKTYSDKYGNTVSLTMILDEVNFPKKYIVSVNNIKTNFPATKRGATEADRYYNNYVTICQYAHRYFNPNANEPTPKSATEILIDILQK